MYVFVLCIFLQLLCRSEIFQNKKLKNYITPLLKPSSGPHPSLQAKAPRPCALGPATSGVSSPTASLLPRPCCPGLLAFLPHHVGAYLTASALLLPLHGMVSPWPTLTPSTSHQRGSLFPPLVKQRSLLPSFFIPPNSVPVFSTAFTTTFYVFTCLSPASGPVTGAPGGQGAGFVPLSVPSLQNSTFPAE